MKKNILALSISAVLLSGCILTDSNYGVDETPERQRSSTLAELDLSPSPQIKAERAKLSLDEISAAYADVLATTDDPTEQAEIQQRIAVLEVMKGEQAQFDESNSSAMPYEGAITSLTSFIASNPNGAGNDKLLYQLAKAYDLQGEQDKSLATLEQLINDYPDNPFMLEVQFRRAEILFSQQQYFAAIASYKVVTAQRDNNPYYTIALYMQGWSYFKLEQNTLALNSFSKILDDIWPYKIMPMVSNLAELMDELEVKNKQLAQETFAVMTLIFSNGEGAEEIFSHYAQLGERPYNYLNFLELGEFYLKKQRYSDAVSVYDEFIKADPSHQFSAFYSIKKMQALELGRYPSELQTEKQRFVTNYQLSSPYWADKDDKTKAEVTPTLLAVMQELAQNSHAKAQEYNRVVVSKAQPTKIQKQRVADAYTETAYWYEMILANFPTHAAATTIEFYLAESFYETKQFAKAASYYYGVAYENTDKVADVEQNDANDGIDANTIDANMSADELKAEAGYALILTYDGMIANEQDADKKAELETTQREYKAQFVGVFSNDSRAQVVQNDVFQQYFKAGEHSNAIEYAQQALNSGSKLTLEQTLSAYLVIGHSQFAEEDYAVAEGTYENLLLALPADDKRRADMQDRLAASIYRQGEIAANAQPPQLETAVKHFARVIEKTPNSKIRINAQYDMATHLLTLERYEQAIYQLADFRDRYPSNKLSSTIPTKLAFAYQQTEQWEQSAAYLKMSWAQQPKAEETRQMLWLSAELYMKAGNKAQALRAYRTYAHTYPTPFNTAIEAKFIMSEFYKKDANQKGDELKYKFWLNKTIQSDASAGEKRTPRSRYLAAKASMYFADEAMGKFTRAKLTLPLNKSLAKKRKLLEQTLTAYDKTVKYQVAEFTTVSSYRIGEVYRQLAKDLMASERPKDLNELELEQYEILLEEQSFPFEDKSIAVHETNAKRSWDGIYDEWVQDSFNALAKLLPGRYNKQEQIVEDVNDVY